MLTIETFLPLKRLIIKQKMLMTKTMILSLLLLLFPAMQATAANKKALHVKMQLQGMGDTLVVQNGKQLTAFTGHDGVFDIMVPLTEPVYITLATPATFRGEDQQAFVIPAVPGQLVEINGSWMDGFTFSGSRFYEDYNALMIEVEMAEQPLSLLFNDLNGQMANGVNQDSLQQVFNERQPSMLQRQNDLLLDMVRRHADSEAVVVLAREFGDDVRMIQQAIGLMSNKVRNGKTARLAYGPLEEAKLKHDSEEDSARKQAAGVEAPDFTLNDINGQPLSLSSLRGKYVLLDFWGSWCTWCKEGFPQMREQYLKYKDQFVILGIDCRDTQETWRQTVRDFQLPWLHVYCPNDTDLFEKYGILGFPTKILVGPDGRIIKSFTGEDPHYYSLIDELFGEVRSLSK